MNRHGFTLSELLVAMGFASLLGILVYSFSQSAFRSARAQQARSEAQDTAYLALSVLTRDLRQAGYAPDVEPPERLARAESARVAVRADLDGDGDCDDSGESVSYQEDATRHTLTRAAGAAAPQPIADNLAAGSLCFTYFDDAGAALDPGAGGLDAASRQRVRRIDVRFAIATPFNLGPVRVAATTSVEVRNAGP